MPPYAVLVVNGEDATVDAKTPVWSLLTHVLKEEKNALQTCEEKGP